MPKPQNKKLLLAGAGHAHIGLLRRLIDKPQPNIEITVISHQPYTVYSGMLPGWMAGHYSLDEIRIDIQTLCRRAKAQFVQSAVTRVTATANALTTADKQHFTYDALSLNTGADTAMDWLEQTDIAEDNSVIPIRPLPPFIAHWQHILDTAQQVDEYHLAIVGAGAAATELVMAAAFALQRIGVKHKVSLVCGDTLLPDFNPRFRRRVVRQLKRHNINILYTRAIGYEKGQLLTTEQALKVDAVIAATGVTGSAWTTNTDIHTVEGGFVAVNSMQQSLSHPNVFAVGDTSERVDKEVAHSGVHAVFGGQVEGRNLLAYLTGTALKAYQPKNRTLYLLSCGDQYAIGSWGKFSMQGGWVWHVKRFIDTRFVHVK